MNDHLLLAAKGDWVQILIGLVVMAIAIINHLIQAQQKKAKQFPQRVQPPAPKPQRVEQTDEVEEFLRRAAQLRRRPQAGPPPAAPKPQRAKSKPPRQRPAPPRPVVATFAPQEQTPRGESVAEHVARQLSAREFEVRASHMVDDLAQADEARERHMAQTFQHQLGQLARNAPGPAAAADAARDTPAAAANVPALAGFSSIDDLRRAILVNEILRRPQF